MIDEIREEGRRRIQAHLGGKKSEGMPSRKFTRKERTRMQAWLRSQINNGNMTEAQAKAFRQNREAWYEASHKPKRRW